MYACKGEEGLAGGYTVGCTTRDARLLSVARFPYCVRTPGKLAKREGGDAKDWAGKESEPGRKRGAFGGCGCNASPKGLSLVVDLPWVMDGEFRLGNTTSRECISYQPRTKKW